MYRACLAFHCPGEMEWFFCVFLAVESCGCGGGVCCVFVCVCVEALGRY